MTDFISHKKEYHTSVASRQASTVWHMLSPVFFYYGYVCLKHLPDQLFNFLSVDFHSSQQHVKASITSPTGSDQALGVTVKRL